MSQNLTEHTLLRLKMLQKEIGNGVEKYLEEGYEAVALHSSSMIIAVNKVCADMFGYSQKDMELMNAWLLFTTDSAQTIMSNLMNQSTEPYQVRAFRKDKSTFTVELKGNDFEIAGEPVRSVQLKEVTETC